MYFGSVIFYSSSFDIIVVLKHDVTLEEGASMPTCSLAEIIRHIWHIMSGTNGIDRLEPIIDDLAQALVQQSCYSEFPERGITRRGPNRLELLLHVVGRQLSPAMFAKDIDRYAREFHVKEPHLKGDKRFGSNIN